MLFGSIAIESGTSSSTAVLTSIHVVVLPDWDRALLPCGDGYGWRRLGNPRPSLRSGWIRCGSPVILVMYGELGWTSEDGSFDSAS